MTTQWKHEKTYGLAEYRCERRYALLCAPWNQIFAGMNKPVSDRWITSNVAETQSFVSIVRSTGTRKAIITLDNGQI